MMLAAISAGCRLLNGGGWKRHFRRCCLGEQCHNRRSRLPALAGSGLEVKGQWYCSRACVEVAVGEAYSEASLKQELPDPAPARRLPLGLLLHARGELDVSTLRRATERASVRNRKLGEVLLEMNLATERQITAALAAQSGCSAYFGPLQERAPALPYSLACEYSVVPIQYVPSQNLLYVGFSSNPNSSVLVAIETVMGCRSAPAIIPDRVVRDCLKTHAEKKGQAEVCFSKAMTPAEVGHICADYAFRRGTKTLRWSNCAGRFWARMELESQCLDLFFPTLSSATEDLRADRRYLASTADVVN